MSMYHFSLGPVQEFVAQARRTRDLWAGSFLLSFLTGKAMCSVLANGGRILFPDVQNDNLIKAISTKQGTPFIGSLPNRFVAELPAKYLEAPEQAVRSAWKQIADAVWKRFVEPVQTGGKDTKAIWDRQVGNFWEIYWCEGAEGALNARKAWRSPSVLSEEGEQCVIMAGWQEISGYFRAQNRKQQDAFWGSIRNSPGQGEHDLRADERLCSIALIKRLFPRVAQEAIGWEVNVMNWPSTAYMAALPFMIESHTHPATEEYLSHLRSENLGRIFGEYSNRVSAFQDMHGERFCNLDGDLLFEAPILNGKDRVELGDVGSDKRDSIHKALKALYDAVGDTPTPHYALLVMDGDRMGKMLRALPEERAEISLALQSFTQKVNGILEEFNGVAVYAGGDDVLAMLPKDKAFAAAQELRNAYAKTFPESGFPFDRFTISAAIVFAHFNTPLLEVLHKAHVMLDERAKEFTGRDAVAVCVLKGEGEHAVWSGKWEHFSHLDTLCTEMNRTETIDRNVSSSFLFRVIETLHLLSSNASTKPGTPYPMLEDLEFRKIFVADYLKARDHWPDRGDTEGSAHAAKLEEATKFVDYMFKACVPYGDSSFLPDGLMIARFFTASGERISTGGE
ncbi:type III-B CRISPR-associated protein Cas10/Cmr2 [Pseudodesulfovibrio sp.]|uniref:type III-B CRISPR-associated protein Cas10/Cmr2 n=1 Tax=unclassified Pseudodesulfovibrio TaxID=2661612 RepID=UPI003B006602